MVESGGLIREARQGSESAQLPTIAGVATRSGRQHLQTQDAGDGLQPVLTRFMSLPGANTSAESVRHFVDCDAELMPLELY